MCLIIFLALMAELAYAEVLNTSDLVGHEGSSPSRGTYLKGAIMKSLMVLADEETFTDLHGCRIVGVPDDFDEDYIDWGRDDIKTITIFMDSIEG